MDLRNKITFEMPLEFKITRPVECPYLDFKMEQRLAADISGRPDTHDTLAKAGFGGLKIGFINLFAAVASHACRCAFHPATV